MSRHEGRPPRSPPPPRQLPSGLSDYDYRFPPRELEREVITIRAQSRTPPRPSPPAKREEIIIPRREREIEQGVIDTRYSPSPPPPAIKAPPIHQEFITHHRHIDHGFENSRPPGEYVYDGPTGHQDPERSASPDRVEKHTSRGEEATADEIRRAAKRKRNPAYDARMRKIDRFDLETDLEYEKSLRRSLWKAGISRDVADKIIDAHRAKEIDKGEVYGSGKRFYLNAYDRAGKDPPHRRDAFEVDQRSKQSNDATVGDGSDRMLHEAEADLDRWNILEKRGRPADKHGVSKDKWSSVLELPPGTRVVRLEGERGAL